jgi:hypothetical protein
MKKPRRKRHRFTRVEISRDGRRIFRVSVAEDVIHTCHDELGALIRKISPGASRSEAPPPESDEVMMHLEHNPDDDLYHARARNALKDLVGVLCDPLLADAIELAQGERERRIAGGGN